MLLIKFAHRTNRRTLLVLHSLAKLCAQWIPVRRTDTRLKPSRQQRAHGREHCFASIDGNVRHRTCMACAGAAGGAAWDDDDWKLEAADNPPLAQQAH